MATLISTISVALIGGALALHGGATENEQGDRIILAELIVGTDNAPTPALGTATQQRNKAGSYRYDRPPAEDDEIGILQPRGGSPAEERAFENRNRARAIQQGGDASLPAYIGGPFLEPGNEPRSTELRSKARAYTGAGNQNDIDLSHVGRDGLPVVECHRVDNVAGRIGDDTASGSVVVLIRNQQQIKVRCR